MEPGKEDRSADARDSSGRVHQLPATAPVVLQELFVISGDVCKLGWFVAVKFLFLGFN